MISNNFIVKKLNTTNCYKEDYKRLNQRGDLKK